MISHYLCASFFIIYNMATYREMAYMVLDQLKIASDDTYITTEHALFLLSKVRALVLKQKYSDIKKEIPQSNYQTICLDLIQVPAISGEPCEGGTYLRSKEKIPATMSVGNTTIYPIDFYQGTHISYISRERMRFVGHNKWLQNIIYASKGPDDYLYFKSSNPQFLYLKKIRISDIFEDPEKAAELECEGEDTSCDILDREFPLEEGLVTSVIEVVVKYLSGAVYKPKDQTNDASDDFSDIMTFIRRNMKSNFQKQIEE